MKKIALAALSVSFAIAATEAPKADNKAADPKQQPAATAAVQPPAAQQQPAATVQQPAATAQQPAATAQQPAADANKK